MTNLPMEFEDIENLFRNAAMKALGIPKTDNKSVRLPHGSSFTAGNAPDFKREENVCFIYIEPYDDGYGQQRHITYEPREGSDMLTRVDNHTDIFEARFTCYGPNGFDWTRKIKAGLHLYEIRRTLRKYGFFLKVGIPPIIHIPELHDCAWWRRFDLKVVFYSAVSIEWPEYISTYERVIINAETY